MSDQDYDEMDIDEDEEGEIQDLHQLNAVLNSDDHCPSSASLFSNSTVSLIDSSTSKIEQYSKIEAALALNKMCDDKLRRLEKILYNRLRDCREKLNEAQDTSNCELQDKMEAFRYVSCGKPYFKDSSNFPAPDNEDTIIMAKTGMYDFSLITSVSGWTIRDKTNFIKYIHKLSQDIRIDKLNSQIADLRRQYKNKPNKAIEKKIATLQRKCSQVNQLSLQDSALPIDQEYDWDSMSTNLNRRHSAAEYRSLWKLFVHPSINKSAWSKEEHLSLQKIAYEEKLQNWECISTRLNSARTHYQCFVYFRTNMSNTFTGRKWTTDEIEYLKRLIEYYREDNYIPWGKVSTSMENRTKIQIYNKYLNLCGQRKGRFLPEEDSVILTCVEKFGLDYHKMTKFLPCRSAAQCRVRYQVLAKKRISTVWTVEEDKKLIQLMANQDTNTVYSSITQYFPGKDRIHIRARYLTLSRWMRRNPNVDLTRAPRRGARRLGHGHLSVNLNKAIDDLKKRIQSEVNDIKRKKISKDSPENMIDDAIVAYLATEKVKLDEPKKYFDECNDTATLGRIMDKPNDALNVTDLRKLLILLRATLNKKKFTNSPLSSRYKGLLDPDPEIHSFQIKSYSKKESVKNVVVNGTGDIWGETRLGPLEYVLPPHYATITGCRKLMSYLSTKPRSDEVVNVQVVLKKNSELKEQMFLFMERFHALFLWPLLLSNSPPDLTILNKSTVQKKYPKRKIVTFGEENYNLALPNYFRIKSDIVDGVIDLAPTESGDVNLEANEMLPSDILNSI